VNATTTDKRFVKAWVLYDGDCSVCIRLARRFENVLARRGFELLPLQTPWVRERLGLSDEQLLVEMRLLFPDGKTFAGADAVVHLSRQIWWAWPLWAISRIPGAMPLLRRGYRWFANRRHCSSACRVESHRRHHGATAFFDMP
jgi:predicted DCC family thiol-disulfide oxidoreductase YuxK